MNVLIAVEGTEGDNRPPLAVAAELADRGHRVRACVPEDYVSYYRARGISARPMGTSTQSFLGSHGSAIYEKPLGYLRTVEALLGAYLERQFEILLADADWADVILTSGFVLAAATVAERIRKPMVHFVYAPVYFRSSFIPPSGVRFLHLPGFVNDALWHAFVSWLDRIAREPINRRRLSVGLDPLASIASHVGAHLALAMDRELAPLPPDSRALGFPQISYPQLDDDTPVPPELERFLDGGPPPVFLTFGSMLDANGGRTMEMISRAAAAIPCRVVVQQHWAGKEACVGLGPGLLAVGRVPHARVFPRMAAVVYHGGAGTFHSAIRAGLPQIPVPHFLDQYYVAHRVSILGVGPRPLRRGTLTVDRLENAIREALENPAYRIRAQALAEMLKSRDGAAEAADLVETLAQKGRISMRAR
jgi:vancomycin aglycone glucosyltransferase